MNTVFVGNRTCPDELLFSVRICRPVVFLPIESSGADEVSLPQFARTVIAALALAAGAGLSANAATGVPSAEDILARSRAAYGALATYSDSGRVLIETGNSRSPARDERTFVTAYQAPHKFLLFYKKGPGPDDEQLVLWWEGEDIHTWWTGSRTHEHYPISQGAVPFALTSYPTDGVTAMIPALLYPKAAMQGPLTTFHSTHDPITEVVEGKTAYKLVGEESQAYGTGNVTGARSVTLWIDAATLLVRKILEDTPHGAAAGDIQRQTVTFEPLANPPLQPSRFHYDPPNTP